MCLEMDESKRQCGACFLLWAESGFLFKKIVQYKNTEVMISIKVFIHHPNFQADFFAAIVREQWHGKENGCILLPIGIHSRNDREADRKRGEPGSELAPASRWTISGQLTQSCGSRS